jgi:DNA-binding FadR family transcriptional regulator
MNRDAARAEIRPRVKLSDHLLLDLARQIVRGSRSAGDRLPAVGELAAQYQVSKPVVRECLQNLAADGLVRVQQGKRTVVLDEDHWDVLSETVREAFRLENRGDELTRQFYEVRGILERSAVALAAERATDDHLAELQDYVVRMRGFAADEDLAAFLAEDRLFHDSIARIAGNTVLRQVTRALHEHLADNWSNSRVTAPELESLTDQHEAIADAVSHRDPDEAVEAMRRHLEWAEAVEGARERWQELPAAVRNASEPEND